MSRLKLLELDLVVGLCTDLIPFRNFRFDIGNGLEEHLFVCSFEISEFLSIDEGYEVRDGIHFEFYRAVSHKLSVNSCKYKVGIIILFGCIFKNWLYPHTGRT
jgi:hypothetical protein